MSLHFFQKRGHACSASSRASCHTWRGLSFDVTPLDTLLPLVHALAQLESPRICGDGELTGWQEFLALDEFICALGLAINICVLGLGMALLASANFVLFLGQAVTCTARTIAVDDATRVEALVAAVRYAALVIAGTAIAIHNSTHVFAKAAVAMRFAASVDARVVTIRYATLIMATVLTMSHSTVVEASV